MKTEHLSMKAIAKHNENTLKEHLAIEKAIENAFKKYGNI